MILTLRDIECNEKFKNNREKKSWDRDKLKEAMKFLIRKKLLRFA